MTTSLNPSAYCGKTRADFVDDLRFNPDMLRVYTAVCHEIAINCWIRIYDRVGSVYGVNDVISAYAIPFTYEWCQIISITPDADIYPPLNSLISLVEHDYPMTATAA